MSNTEKLVAAITAHDNETTWQERLQTEIAVTYSNLTDEYQADLYATIVEGVTETFDSLNAVVKRSLTIVLGSDA